MKRIEKQVSPPEFENWKKNWRAKNGASLEDLYNQEGMTGKKLWAALGTSENEDRLYSKEQLRGELLKEQGLLCCYCNREIEFLSSNTEHFKSKGKSVHFKLAYDYQNLLASCDGFVTDPRPREVCCNARRIEDDDLPLSPLQKDIESHFDFTIDGQIIGLTEIANDTIAKLGLDINQLQDERAVYIRDALYQNPFDDIKTFISKEDAEKEIADLKKLKEFKFKPYCVAITKVLEREVLNKRS